MPSFDIVSEFNMQEVTNAVNQATREVQTRYDFKGLDVSFELSGTELTLVAPNEFHLGQMMDILSMRLSKRGVDVGCMDKHKPEVSSNRARQKVVLRRGIEQELAKKIIKTIKDRKLKKVQSQSMESKVRVTGKNRDDLQSIIVLMKDGNWGLPLQFENFRD